MSNNRRPYIKKHKVVETIVDPVIETPVVETPVVETPVVTKRAYNKKPKVELVVEPIVDEPAPKAKHQRKAKRQPMRVSLQKSYKDYKDLKDHFNKLRTLLILSSCFNVVLLIAFFVNVGLGK